MYIKSTFLHSSICVYLITERIIIYFFTEGATIEAKVKHDTPTEDILRNMAFEKVRKKIEVIEVKKLIIIVSKVK